MYDVWNKGCLFGFHFYNVIHAESKFGKPWSKIKGISCWCSFSALIVWDIFSRKETPVIRERVRRQKLLKNHVKWTLLVFISLGALFIWTCVMSRARSSIYIIFAIIMTINGNETFLARMLFCYKRYFN